MMNITRPTPVCLFDLDGVIRFWNDDLTADIERRHGLSPGIIERIAFASDLDVLVTTGIMSKKAWLAEVATRIGGKHAFRAVSDWACRGFYASWPVVQLASRARMHGRIALVTNGTSELKVELEWLGLDELFCIVFNSATLGFAKPDPCIYEMVVNSLGVDPDRIYYIDDRRPNVESAQGVGISSQLYTDCTEAEEFFASVFETPARECCERNHGSEP